MKVTDVTVYNTTAKFGDTVTLVTLPLTVVHDAEPELDESLPISLGATLAGNATVRPDAVTMTLIIPENDNPRGVFQFAAVHAALARYPETPGPTDPPTIVLDVVRTAGALASVTLQFVT
jgi:hypothetical protein